MFRYGIQLVSCCCCSFSPFRLFFLFVVVWYQMLSPSTFPSFFFSAYFPTLFYRTMNVRNVGYVDVSLLFSLLFNLSTIHVCIFCRSGSHTHTRTDKHSTTTVSLQSLVVPAEQSPAVLYTLLTSLRRAQAPHRRYIRQYRHRQSIECVNRFQRKILLRPMPSRRSPLHVDPR